MKTRDYGTNPPKAAVIPNTHRAPPKQWRRWSQRSQIVFNDLYRLLRHNQTIFTHPKADVIPDKHWATIAWNAAWEAADAAAYELVMVPGTVVKDIANGKKVVREHVVQ